MGYLLIYYASKCVIIYNLGKLYNIRVQNVYGMLMAVSNNTLKNTSAWENVVFSNIENIKSDSFKDMNFLQIYANGSFKLPKE